MTGQHVPPTDHHGQPAMRESIEIPPDAPAWITREMIERTIRVWQPHFREPVTTDMAVEMLVTVRRLGEWMERVDSLRRRSSTPGR